MQPNRCHFQSEFILWAVRWYCKYGISYRDLEEMLCERGVEVDHTTLYRWVQRYASDCAIHLVSGQDHGGLAREKRSRCPLSLSKLIAMVGNREWHFKNASREAQGLDFKCRCGGFNPLLKNDRFRESEPCQ